MLFSSPSVRGPAAGPMRRSTALSPRRTRPLFDARSWRCPMATETLVRVAPCDLSVRDDATGRTLFGIVVPYNVVATVSDGGPSYEEMFAPGAFSRSVQQRADKIKLLTNHN